MWNLLPLLPVLVQVAWGAGLNTSVCTIPKAGVPHYKPDIPQVYEVHIECIIKDKNMSTEVHEYFDSTHNKGMVKQTEKGISYFAYFDYKNNEFLGIFPKQKKCTVSTLSTSEQRFLFGYNATGKGGRIFSAAGALHFSGEAVQEVFKGRDTIRGINVNKWYSCQYWSGMDATMDVTWYFSDNQTWQTALGLDTVPVRAHVNGYRGSNQNEVAPHFFDHIYDFIDFRNYISTPFAFETPSMVSCPGRPLTKPIPKFSDAFSFTVEIIDPNQQAVRFMKEWYNLPLKIVKYVYTPSKTTSSGNLGYRPLTEIHDFNTGMAYVTDNQLGNCTWKLIEHNGFDVTKSDGFDVRLRTASQFFSLDKKGVTYEGVKYARGILTDTYVGKMSNFPPSSPMNTTFEWHVLTSQYSRSQTASDLYNNSVPVQFRLSVSEYNIMYYYNIYNYVQAQPIMLSWDISPCYRDMQKRSFDFTFPGKYASKIDSNRELFTYKTYIRLMTHMSVKPLRISRLRLVFQKDVHVRFTLLDVAPIRGDVKNVIKETPLAVAANNFTSSVKNKKFQVLLNYDSFSNGIAIVANPDSVREYVYEDELVQPAPATGFSSGAMWGLGVAMVVVGSAGGAGGAFLFFK